MLSRTQGKKSKIYSSPPTTTIKKGMHCIVAIKILIPNIIKICIPASKLGD